MIGGIVNKTREDEREERKRGRERKREREKKEKREKEREREREERTEERERREREPSVCAFNTPACVRSKRLRVYRQHAHMKKTCGHVAGTHGDILNAHTGTC